MISETDPSYPRLHTPHLSLPSHRSLPPHVPPPWIRCKYPFPTNKKDEDGNAKHGHGEQEELVPDLPILRLHQPVHRGSVVRGAHEMDHEAEDWKNVPDSGQ